MRLLFLSFLAVGLVAGVCAEECAECICLSLPPLSGADSASANPIYRWSQGEAETNRIDVLITYDESARKWLETNGYGSLEDFARAEIECVNNGIANTGLDKYFTFRLAGTKTIAVDLSGKTPTDTILQFCGKLAANSSIVKKAIKEVWSLRDAVAADVVAVLVDFDKKSRSGISYKLTKNDLSTNGLKEISQYAYCICDISKLTSRFTLMHELGHIFGAGHDDEQHSDPGPQLKAYSSGYRFEVDGTLNTTVMGITSSDGKTFIRWPFFSSPLYTFGETGPVVGTESHHDNTRTLRETYHIIANYRVATPLGGGVEEGSESDAIALTVAQLSDVGEIEPVRSGSDVKLVRSVNATFSVEVSAPSSSKATVKVKGLPSGMKYAAKTGLIAGCPRKAGKYAVTVTATCKGFKTVTRQFSISVADIPASLPGTYIGFVALDSGSSVMTLSVAANGKTTLKGRIDGKTRTFKAAGMSSALELEDGGRGMAFMARPTAKINGSERTFDLLISDRMAESSGFSGALCQSPWGRKDVSAPKIAKTFTVAVGEYQCRIGNNGRVLVSGKPNGVRVSGSFQLVPEEPAAIGDGAVFRLPIMFPAKKSFKGLATAFRFRLSVDQHNRVSNIEWIGE